MLRGYFQKEYQKTLLDVEQLSGKMKRPHLLERRKFEEFKNVNPNFQNSLFQI